MSVHVTISHSTPAKNKSVALAYLFLVLFSGFGIHRFYLGRPVSGIIMLLLTLSGFALIFPLFIVIPWLVIDLFLIPSMAR
jgi:TM2 domain-containing membrane protein YozV